MTNISRHVNTNFRSQKEKVGRISKEPDQKQQGATDDCDNYQASFSESLPDS